MVVRRWYFNAYVIVEKNDNSKPLNVKTNAHIRIKRVSDEKFESVAICGYS